MTRLRYVDPPSGLLGAIERQPEGSQLVVGSGYFLRLMPGATAYEVWLTPRRCHFSMQCQDLTDEARLIIETSLPRFTNLMTPLARKTIEATPWRWRDLLPDTPFIWSADDASQPIHSFCQLGNWILFAGPYAFHYSAPFQPPVWGPLLEIDVDLITAILKIGYCCNPRPYLQPSSFSAFVVACHRPVEISAAEKHLVDAHIRERQQQDAERERKQKIIIFNCPHCTRELRARFYMAREDVSCKHCGEQVKVPAG